MSDPVHPDPEVLAQLAMSPAPDSSDWLQALGFVLLLAVGDVALQQPHVSCVLHSELVGEMEKRSFFALTSVSPVLACQARLSWGE